MESIVVGYPLSLSLPLTGRLIDLMIMKYLNKTLPSSSPQVSADSYHYYLVGLSSHLLRFTDFLPLPDLLLRLPLLRMESKQNID